MAERFEKTIDNAFMAEIGRKGGVVGGKSRSEAKRAAARENVKKATAARLAKRWGTAP